MKTSLIGQNILSCVKHQTKNQSTPGWCWGRLRKRSERGRFLAWGLQTDSTLKTRPTAWSRGSIWWLLKKLQRDFPLEISLPQGTDRRILQVYLHSQVHSSTAQDSRKGEETQASMAGDGGRTYGRCGCLCMCGGWV